MTNNADTFPLLHIWLVFLDETGDAVGGVVEQPSIYSPDHSKGGWVNPKSTSKPNTPSKSHSGKTAWVFSTISV